jgi:predicted phage terminase large subunit-like protein
MSIVSDAYKRWKEHCKNVQAATVIVRQQSEKERQAYIRKLKSDYSFFVSEMFPHYATAPCAKFHISAANAILDDPNFFGVLEWPREHAKSVHADIIIPTWLWVNNQLQGMILKGKNQDDANNLLGDIQAEFEYNQRIKHYFGEQKKLGNWTEGEFEISDGILFKAYGRDIPVRGIRNREKRPNYYVFDDLDDDEIVLNQERVEKVVDTVLGSDYGAMDIKATRFVGVGNRIHPKSILAHVVGDIDQDKPKRKGLYHSKVMATEDGTFTGVPTWPEKYGDGAELRTRFERMGYFLANREYFHNPIIKGKIFKAEWMHWGRVPDWRSFDHIVAYFDPSYKAKTTSDYKAIKVWGKKGLKLYNIDAFLKQASITEAVKWLYDFHESLPTDVIVDYYMEEVFLQDMFYEDFAAEAKLRGYYLPIRGDTRKKPDKYMRVQAIAPLWERGFVTYDIRQKRNSHMVTGVNQSLAFQKSNTIHDDGPDADEGAIWILMNWSRQDAFPGNLGRRSTNKVW